MCEDIPSDPPSVDTHDDDSSGEPSNPSSSASFSSKNPPKTSQTSSFKTKFWRNAVNENRVEIIDLDHINGATFQLVLTWLQKHDQQMAQSEPTKPLEGQYEIHYGPFSGYSSRNKDSTLPENEEKFFQENASMVGRLLIAADFLGIESLLKSGSKFVANMMKGKSTRELKSMFNIPSE